MSNPEDAALLKDAERFLHVMQPIPAHNLVRALAQALSAALAREAELIADAEQEFVVTGRIVERAEQAERERDTLRTVYGRASSTLDDAALPVEQSADQVERVKALSTNTSEGKPRTP